MNQQDGEKIFKLVEDFINTELAAGNRVTKCNGNYLGGTIAQVVSEIVTKDIQKEEMWSEVGQEWLKKKKEPTEKDGLPNDLKSNIIKLEEEAEILNNKVKAGSFKKGKN